VEHFCIKGTVAHLLCQVDFVLNEEDEKTSCCDSEEKANDGEGDRIQDYEGDKNATSTGSKLGLVDDEHYLISATVIDAYCREDYWDSKKNMFRPRDTTVKPYLTFLGSQSFGYVQCGNSNH